MIFEVRADSRLVASCSDCATALSLARQWLREPAQRDAGTHTCVLQTRDGNDVVAEQVVALRDGPLAS